MNRYSYKDFYNIVSNEYSPGDRKYYYYKDDRFFNVQCLVNPGKKEGLVILDIGCGNGWQIAPCIKGNQVYGLDISEANIEKAVAKGIKAQVHDVEDLFPFEDDFFDTVVCSEILEHLFFPEKVLREIYRVLKTSGRLIVTVPNLYCFQNRLSILVGKGCKFVEYPMNRQHIRSFSLDGMSRILKEAGFKTEYYRGESFNMNFSWPFQLIWYLHGGNKGLRIFIKIVTLGRKRSDIPGILLKFYIIQFLGWLLPRWSPGLIFACRKI
ncbi:MAG: class I SAM-dependent methyltransferase [Candidatus Scalindua sp.]|nr:class I SAM-dependent methyltransferase [Candidatus Scalindua sp.]